jgi:tetratricopeptide (TPR) repeat protein
MQDETDEVTDYIYVFDEADAVNSLRHRNFPMVMDHVNEYRRLEYDTNVVIETLAREIQNFEEAFQGQFLLTATMRGTLGTIYLGAGRVDNAEKVFRDLVRCFEESEDHGVMHRDTLWCQRLLAEVLRQNNKLQEAKELIHRVLKRSEKPDGEINPHIIECKANLGCIHFEADLLEEATTLFLEVQRDATQLLGLEHPQTLFAMTNLASAYRAQSMLSEAEELDLAVLDIKKRTLDDKNRSHYSTVTSAANLAFTYFLQKRWDEAMKIENWVLKERINSLGNDHPATLRARKQLEETKCHRDMALNQGLGSQEESLALKLQPKEPSSKKRKEFAA